MNASTAGSTRRGSGSFIRLNDLKVIPAYESMLRENRLDCTDSLFNCPAGASLSKPGLARWRERIRLELLHHGEPKTYYLKRFVQPTGSARFAMRLARNGATAAAVEWNWIHELSASGLPCPSPVALGESLNEKRELRSALLMEAVPGESLESWASRPGPRDRSTIAVLLAASADLVAALHHCGFAHRDLYLSHLFFDPEAPPLRALHLIDLQRIIRPAMFTRRWFIKDLAALNFSTPGRLVSRSDRLRWLKRYLGTSALDAPARRLAYRVAGKTARIARHDQRRSARLQAMEVETTSSNIGPITAQEPV